MIEPSEHGIRFGDLTDWAKMVKACATAFDVFSFNCYMELQFKMMDRAMEIGPSIGE